MRVYEVLALCWTSNRYPWPWYQVSVYRIIGPLVQILLQSLTWKLVDLSIQTANWVNKDIWVFKVKVIFILAQGYLHMVGWLIDFLCPVNNFSVMLGRSLRFLGISSTFCGVNVPCSRTQHGLARVGLEPTPLAIFWHSVFVKSRTSFEMRYDLKLDKGF